MRHRLIDELAVHGDPTLEHVAMDELENFRFPDGGGFPPSYVAFVRRVGWARLFGLWLLYPPVRPGYADGLSGRGGNLTERLGGVSRCPRERV